MNWLLALLLWAAPPEFAAELRAGLVSLNKHDYATARQHLTTAAELDPQNAVSWIALAQTYSGLKEPDQARLAAEKAAALGPDQPVIQHALALFYRNEPNLPQAATWERRYAASPTADAQASSRAALWSLEANQPNEANPWIERAISSNPANNELRFTLVEALLKREQFVPAIRLLEDGRRLAPADPQFALALGVAYYGQRRFPEAVQVFLETNTLAPELEQPYIFLGKMLDQSGDRLSEIATRFASFYKTNPTSGLPALLLAKSLSLQNEPKSAEALLRESIAKQPDLWESHFELGVLLSKRTQWQPAADQLTRAIALNPREPAPYYHLARVYDRLGKQNEANAARTTHQRLTAPASSGMQQGGITIE